MDNTPEHITTNFASRVSKTLSKAVDAQDGYSAVSAFQLDSPGVSSSYFSNQKRSNRKWGVIDGSLNLQDGPSLIPRLGYSSSSCISILSSKEIEDSSFNLDPSVSLHLGDERTADPTRILSHTPRAFKEEKPKLDLELSLSTGPAESDITTVTQGSYLFQDSVEALVTASTVQLVDEGSTSSRWKQRPLVAPLQSTETTAPFDHVSGHIGQIPFVPVLLSSETTATPKSVGLSASGTVPQQQRRNTSVKICQFYGCVRGARGASGFCIAHGGGRRCQRVGCQKGAEGKTVFCKAHGGGRRCQHLGCTKSAEGCTDYCIGHGGGRRCSHDSCIRAARGKSGLCIRHGGGRRCQRENCSKSAEGISGLCISHGGGRRCQYTACSKGAQGSTMFCKAHGGGKRCTFLGCMKGAEGSTPFCKGHGGGKRCTYEGGCTKSVHGGTLFCVNHGGGKRCAIAECTKSARGWTNFCVRHGGGKRCKYEGCGKSAQGSTDFCKAHGGGKRCAWGQADAPCDKFARGKSGLCASHYSQIQDIQVDHDSTVAPTLPNPQSCMFQKMKGTFASEKKHAGHIPPTGMGGASTQFIDYGHQSIPMQIPLRDSCIVGNAGLGQFSLPEGRVHGGGLMAMLRGDTNFELKNRNHVSGVPSEPEKSHPMTRSWM